MTVDATARYTPLTRHQMAWRAAQEGESGAPGDRSRRPTAILCANDLMAIGVMRYCREAGIAIPGDLSLTGFDDIAGAEFLQPALSTVAQPAHDMGKAAARLLLHRVGVRAAGAAFLAAACTAAFIGYSEFMGARVYTGAGARERSGL